MPAAAAPPPPADAPATAQLASILAALSHCASLVDASQHEALLRARYRISLWSAPAPAAHAWLDLLLHLTAVRAVFLQPCVRHLVDAFAPPPRLEAPPGDAEEAYEADERTRAVHAMAVGALARLLRHQPLARRPVQELAGERMPHALQPRHMHCAYVRAMLLLAGAALTLSACVCWWRWRPQMALHLSKPAIISYRSSSGTHVSREFLPWLGIPWYLFS